MGKSAKHFLFSLKYPSDRKISCVSQVSIVLCDISCLAEGGQDRELHIFLAAYQECTSLLFREYFLKFQSRCLKMPHILCSYPHS